MDVVYASQSASVSLPNGGQIPVHKGTHWAADDPVVAQYPHLFSVDPRYGLQYTQEPTGWNDPPVEQATAAPGEKRNARRTS
jgi:hypothetical protein